LAIATCSPTSSTARSRQRVNPRILTADAETISAARRIVD